MSDIDKLGPWKKVDIKSGYKDRGFMISSQEYHQPRAGG